MGFKLPIIDISSFVNKESQESDRLLVVQQIRDACLVHGFFYLVGHGVQQELIDRLDSLSRLFFQLDEETKQKYRMELGGKAWRGFFSLGGELTSGKPDMKEGLYLGQELEQDHPLPIHGPNLFPTEVEGFKATILEYIDQITQLGHRVMEALSLSLNLDSQYFSKNYTADPLILFRIFNYRTQVADDASERWGVGEHTDYGLLTILYQDNIGGLQVKVPNQGWIPAPPIKNSFICNIGDMLERVTGGLYRSTPHRVALNTTGKDRLSFPIFFDPNFNAKVRPIEGIETSDNSTERWDKSSVFSFEDTYGQYLLKKIGLVFPDLKSQALDTTNNPIKPTAY
ncbi:Probable iron/ascorbate oxidoreductase [Heterostelium album PN500]|uniref:Probable iron/ascorbate oxidoreductase n=1 Tax=Heterostelium pallidum (strain ATCC 26659 / Pp 5 / PN500) TaxID=670386 RepID=D3BJJ6_HETP5|nr:Probable iron/ascorbate oxidoreductase [Heterostelium album PN500]EFA78076.1 Probable iron/ascorbate oxidoreductase [Heterostelium album PN500]|eukprot:XP_020430203.1 Probable iron/ascorbate oxidoreductase [Heterostelium album PN500]